MAGDLITAERHIRSLARACAEPSSGHELLETATRRLRRMVEFDGSAWFATDPATLLATNPALIENIEAGHCESYWQREYLVEDVLLYRDLARAPRPAATLYAVTDDRPARSARYREFLAPQGYGDELRAALRVHGFTWGVIDLFRERGRPPFSPRDVEVTLAAGPAIATALRALALPTASPAGASGSLDGPGTALFDSAGAVCSLDEQAHRWFTELAGPHWNATNAPLTMTTVVAALARARAVAEGRHRGPASTRLRTSTGRWLAVHASCLRDPDGVPGLTAVVIEPARSAQIAPIIVEAYRLTPREQQITQAVARGLSSHEIATQMYLSTYTVRDHLKAIFAKVGVSSRGELVAKLFAEHYGPALHEPGAAVHIER
jgi:DNA-binding CsgD family transcriptional regulator